MPAFPKIWFGNVASRKQILSSIWVKSKPQTNILGSTTIFRGTGARWLTHTHQNIHYFQQTSNFHSALILRAELVSFTLSDIGEGIVEVVVKEWFVKVGDKVSQFDNICEVQSDKASVTITSRFDGVIKKLYYDVDDTAYVGKPLVDLAVSNHSDNSNQSSSSDEETPASRTTPLAPPVVGHQNTDTSPRLVDKSLATPAVRRIAVENNVDLSSVQGTGKAGRVLKEDILSYVGKPATLTHNTLNTLEETIVPVKGIMKAMIKSMTLSQSIPHFVYSDEILVGPLNDICKSLKHESQAKGIKLTLLPFFIKAASKALEQYPILNSSLDKNCENIIYKSGHNIGIAMDTPGGLVVPNIKNVQSLSVLELAEKLAKLRSSSLKGSLQLEDVTGGTITLSNIGSIGGTYTKPVILHPEVAIGAFGKIQGVPRFDLNGKLIRAEVLCVSWAGDHRVIDGATMARFSNAWKHFIENPALLLVTL